jgi:hypothetical protein
MTVPSSPSNIIPKEAARNLSTQRWLTSLLGCPTLQNYDYLRSVKGVGGDKYSARKLAETERNLRTVSYIYDAHVVPVKYVEGSHGTRYYKRCMDLESRGFIWPRGGGANNVGFNLEDSNLFRLRPIAGDHPFQQHRSNEHGGQVWRSQPIRFPLNARSRIRRFK